MTSSFAVTFDIDTTKILQNWQDKGYDDTGWKSGATPIGYGTTTGIKSACAAVNAVYFRKTFTIPDASLLTGLGLLVKGRDGAVVWLNGQEIERINLPAEEEITAATPASTALTTNLTKMVVINATNGLEHIHSGENLIAVEIHAFDFTRGIAFDAQLIDSKNTILFKQGSGWQFYDAGDEPAHQLRDKATGVSSSESAAFPRTPFLEQNYPNPFNPVTSIPFSLPAMTQVSLKVYSITGAEVATLVDTTMPQGRHEMRWQADGVASGLYLLHLQAGAHRAVRKALILK